jgi:membrane protein YdbS with pleckstrin-like domain
MIDNAAELTIDPIPEPHTRLDPRARRQWLLEELITWAFVVPVFVGIAIGARFLFDLSWRWPIGVGVVMVAIALILTLTVPQIRYRQWRYEIRDREIDLRFGVFTHTRQLIPISRVQHVDTRRGPLQRRFGLATVVFFTAAGSIEIPALALETANDVRDRIAALANVQDDL